MEIRWKGRPRRVVTMIGRQQLKIHNECVLYYGQLFEGQRRDDRVWGRCAAWGRRQSIAIGPLLCRMSKGGGSLRFRARKGAAWGGYVGAGVLLACWAPVGAGSQPTVNGVGKRHRTQEGPGEKLEESLRRAGGELEGQERRRGEDRCSIVNVCVKWSQVSCSG